MNAKQWKRDMRRRGRLRRRTKKRIYATAAAILIAAIASAFCYAASKDSGIQGQAAEESLGMAEVSATAALKPKEAGTE